jgi:hypothetical protein
VVDAIAKHVQPTELNVAVLVDEQLRAANVLQMEENRAAKRASVAEKKRAAELKKKKSH